MKLPITDKFLMSVCNCTEKLDKTFDIFAYKTIEKAYCPALYDLKKEYERQKNKQKFSQLIYRLKKNGYIKIKNLEQNEGVILTKKGAKKVLKIKFKIEKRKRRSDEKWQMIIFDIPEKKRHLRDLLREKLRFLEYKMLQQSIWVCPYNVQKETELVLRKNSLDPYVKIFLIKEIEL